MKEIELKAQLKILERLILLCGWVNNTPVIPDPLEYIHNQLLEMEKIVKSQLADTTKKHKG